MIRTVTTELHTASERAACAAEPPSLGLRLPGHGIRALKVARAKLAVYPPERHGVDAASITDL